MLTKSSRGEVLEAFTVFAPNSRFIASSSLFCFTSILALSNRAEKFDLSITSTLEYSHLHLAKLQVQIESGSGE
jgi:hypothetical protein